MFNQKIKNKKYIPWKLTAQCMAQRQKWKPCKANNVKEFIWHKQAPSRSSTQTLLKGTLRHLHGTYCHKGFFFIEWPTNMVGWDKWHCLWHLNMSLSKEFLPKIQMPTVLGWAHSTWTPMWIMPCLQQCTSPQGRPPQRKIARSNGLGQHRKARWVLIVNTPHPHLWW